ncbi:hypothetical protein HanXRQr2_Chr02g0085321 [Helianthus annuus]|uniref:Uncharacterized protein n=1 Tax=Helianthus annuus TaxID=4232 RepID=A0A9K3P129_HELAN|nr:hypothetical protein HanXRQr2_Chr02g0085321 [Helianthus annuus]KAJ0953316.1 hypothetical protein HanPSC8_Chr02g0082441 [Helianthus annuus]
MLESYCDNGSHDCFTLLYFSVGPMTAQQGCSRQNMHRHSSITPR